MHKHFLYSPHRSILPQNPVATFTSHDDIQGFLNFANKHQDKILIGYLSYDLGHLIHGLPLPNKPGLTTPNIHFTAYQTYQELNSEQTKQYLKQQTKPLPPKPKLTKFQTQITKKQYNQAYQQIKQHITAGDIYQINLTHQLKAQTNLDPWQLFLHTINKNPVSYGAYLDIDTHQIISASPERFIEIKDNTITTSPIKGTTPRHNNPKQDQANKQTLIDSPKEAAELNMITDLLRNDLGKNAKPGTVKVSEQRQVTGHAKVWHTHSTITAQLSNTPIKTLIDMLPGGSITGCPKRRAMQIIDQLEPQKRGIYTGVIGYIMPDQQELQFSIAIRTIIKQQENLYLHVGGGIVLDSKQDSEFEETLQKAASFQNII